MAKITENEKVQLNQLSYDEGKEKLYSFLLEKTALEVELARIKDKKEYLDSAITALYEAVMEKASDQEKEAKKIISNKMICQENEIIENKTDLGKIANLMKTNEKFKNAFIKLVESKGLNISTSNKLVKQINTIAGEVIVSLEDVQSPTSKTETVLSPITDIIEIDELE